MKIYMLFILFRFIIRFITTLYGNSIKRALVVLIYQSTAGSSFLFVDKSYIKQSYTYYIKSNSQRYFLIKYLNSNLVKTAGDLQSVYCNLLEPATM